jgi:hypothetical protein
MPALSPYSKQHTLSKLDGRTRESRLMRSLREELVAHVGGEPSAPQIALIERAVQLSLRVAIMDRKFADAGEMTEHDTKTYLAWSGHLARVLRDLGPPASARPPTPAEALQRLHDHLAGGGDDAATA